MGHVPNLSSLAAIEAACVKALDEGDASDFRCVVNPESTMAICDMARNALTLDELPAMGKLLDDLKGYIADHSPMYDDERDALFRRVSDIKRLVGVRAFPIARQRRAHEAAIDGRSSARTRRRPGTRPSHPGPPLLTSDITTGSVPSRRKRRPAKA